MPILDERALTDWIEQFAADGESLSRTYPLALSPARLARWRRFLAESQHALASVAPAADSLAAVTDYLLITRHVSHRQARLEREAQRLERVTEALPFWPQLLDVIDAHRRHEPPVPDAVARDLTQWADDLAERTRHIPERGPLSPEETVLFDDIAQQVRAITEALSRWHAFYHHYDPVFTWWVATPYGALTQALKAYGERLTDAVTGGLAGHDAPIVGLPIGDAGIAEELSHAMIAYTADELIEMAETELAWCVQQMTRAAHDLGYGNDWHQALEHVKNLTVPPGEQPALIYRLAAEGVQYARKHDLVTVPDLADETWRAQMMPAERQWINPFFTGGEVISISYPTDEMPYAQRRMSMRGNNIYFSRSTVFHELIPGHYLQQFMNARHRRYRRLFRNPFWLEGNAFYWEMVYWDLGFPATPEEKIGMLFWRMHRSARVLYTLKFHQGRMTTEEAVTLLIDQVGHEPDNARGEVRRLVVGGYEPLYQCAYMVGALQFRGLARELVGSGTMTPRAFHDAILTENQMPVEVLRSVLRHEPLPASHVPSWRFYTPPAD